MDVIKRFDVVVIGAGGAGLCAAVAAKQQGAKVVVITKTRSGLGTCTAYAGGGFTLACGSMTVAEHSRLTQKVGRGINDPSLVNVLSSEGEAALRELAALGITIRIGDNGHASVYASAPTGIMGGAGLTRELTALARQLGVEFLEYTVATRLQVDDSGVHGVECTNWQSGQGFTVGAGAVILATGGAGHIYERTDNPARVTGDGYALALRAGLPLVDMEFVQFYPLGWDEPKFPKWMIGLPTIDRVRLTDAAGREFLKEELDRLGLANGVEANLFGRDVSARLVGQKSLEGGAYLHFQELPPEAWGERAFSEARRFYPEGVKPWDYGPIQVSPIQHYFTGGVVIDSLGRTSVEGLLACGEVTGGVDGASRIGGNALTNIITFGLRAGRAAADCVRARSTVASAGKLVSGQYDPASVRAELKAIVQAGLGPVRTGEGIGHAVAQLEDLQPKVASLSMDTPMKRLLALEMPGMWQSARAVAAAALERQESRGVHYRTDYPTELDSWQRNIEVRLKDGKLTTE
ncbi:MAG: FAD-dependent oxidoreductase [Bacillota bacterium]|nr:FAD-dependent oxidoreductase [Bacillota bacterium]